MSQLLQYSPYSLRRDDLFLEEINFLTEHHLKGCDEYRDVFPDWSPAESIEHVPYLHVDMFKHLNLRTKLNDSCTRRTLKSSATTSDNASRITLDSQSCRLQNQSVKAIWENFLCTEQHPLLILDSSHALLKRGGISARTAAAMSLRQLACDIYFILRDSENPNSVKWEIVKEILDKNEKILIYGFTWILWQSWGMNKPPDFIQKVLANKQINFIHSGGWKNLDAQKIGREQFNSVLTGQSGPKSRVIDFYGLVEQVGVIYPLCKYGYRHIPIWADVIVRDPRTLKPLNNKTGQLQLINTIALGAPYHSILTEDMGRLVHGLCKCGRLGQRFELNGRIPKSEIRGCSNV